MRFFFILCLSAGILFLSVVAGAAERRCGWYVNPTPANHLFIDKDGDWWIMMQGREESGAQGMDKLPDFDKAHFVETQGGHGYGCTCMNVETDRKEQRITRVISSQVLPLSTCRNDKSLKRPD